jgi:hypothetical protein
VTLETNLDGAGLLFPCQAPELISAAKAFNFAEPHRPKLTLKVAIPDMDTKEMLTAQIC